MIMATDGMKISEMPELSELSGDEYIPVIDTENGKQVNKKVSASKFGGGSSSGGGVGMVDPNSDGTGEIFNAYEGEYANKATGIFAHAEGGGNTASGQGAHAEGAQNTASGQGAHAEGIENTASGDGAHAEGHGTIAKNLGEHAEGTFNQSNTGSTEADKTIHSIGIGTSDADRKNAVEVMMNGDVYIVGIGGYDGTNYSSAQTLQEVISSLLA